MTVRDGSSRAGGHESRPRVRHQTSFAAIAVAATFATLQGGGVARYVISSDGNTRRVDVALEYVVGVPELMMDTATIEGLDGGWASFVRDLRASSGGGSREVTRIAPGRWRVSAARGERVRISYAVAIHHDSVGADGAPIYQWSGGPLEVAFAAPELWVATGRTLFVMPAGLAGAEVSVRGPPGWRGVASWEGRGDSRQPWRVTSAAALLAGFVAGGMLQVTTGRIAGLSVTVATHGDRLADRHTGLVRTGQMALGSLARLLNGVPARVGDVPVRSVTALVAETSDAVAGGAVVGKDVIIAVPADHATSPRLDAAIAHELAHLWTSHPRPASSREAWFAEGAAEFLGQRAMREAGLVDSASYRAVLNDAWERYRMDSWIAMHSIARAGSAIREHRALVYDGGLLVVACLDADMRRATDGARGVDDLVRQLAGSGEQARRSYENTALYAAIAGLSNDVVSRALARWVEGSAPLALWRCATE